jgi:hypothetical protein
MVVYSVYSCPINMASTSTKLMATGGSKERFPGMRAFVTKVKSDQDRESQAKLDRLDAIELRDHQEAEEITFLGNSRMMDVFEEMQRVLSEAFPVHLFVINPAEDDINNKVNRDKSKVDTSRVRLVLAWDPKYAGHKQGRAGSHARFSWREISCRTVRDKNGNISAFQLMGADDNGEPKAFPPVAIDAPDEVLESAVDLAAESHAVNTCVPGIYYNLDLASEIMIPIISGHFDARFTDLEPVTPMYPFTRECKTK